LELEPGNSAPFTDGTFIPWAVDATFAARVMFDSQGTAVPLRTISHAPLGPYLATWAGPERGYVEIYNRASEAIDYLFIQYYNQGEGVYDSYEEIFSSAGGATLVSGSSVAELRDAGIPSSKIVVGKYILATDGSNGWVAAADLADWIAAARQGPAGFAGGIGGWQYHTDTADFDTWVEVVAATRTADNFSPDTSDSDSGGLSGGAISGIVIAVVVVVAIVLVIGAVFLVPFRRKNGAMPSTDLTYSIMESNNT